MRKWPSSGSGMGEVAYIALGSNLGGREQHLAFALGEIGRLPGTRILSATPPEETPPEGILTNRAGGPLLIAPELAHPGDRHADVIGAGFDERTKRRGVEHPV